jgi:hypothetical protein
MLEQTMIIVLTGIISALISYFFTMQASKKSTTTQVREVREELMRTITETIVHHNEANHKDDLRTAIKMAISEHVEMCGGSERLPRIERALVFLVTRAGGSPSDLGLE